MVVLTIVTSAQRNSSQRFRKGTEVSENQMTNRDHLGYRIVKIGQNTEKSLRDLRRLAVTQTLVKDHHLKLRLKNSQRVV